MTLSAGDREEASVVCEGGAMASSKPQREDGDEGRDGQQVAYDERLWPRWWVWLVPPALVSVLAVAYGAAYDIVWGWILFAVGTLAGVAALVLLSPQVRVDDRVVRAGTARLPLAYVGEVTTLTSDDLRRIRAQGDARAYVVLRPWSTPEAVRIDVTDPDDPHPYWLVSSRTPDALASAVRASAAGSRPAAPPSREHEDRAE